MSSPQPTHTDGTVAVSVRLTTDDLDRIADYAADRSWTRSHAIASLVRAALDAGQVAS
jgi:hypothetical protein